MWHLLEAFLGRRGSRGRGGPSSGHILDGNPSPMTNFDGSLLGLVGGSEAVRHTRDAHWLDLSGGTHMSGCSSSFDLTFSPKTYKLMYLLMNELPQYFSWDPHSILHLSISSKYHVMILENLCDLVFSRHFLYSPYLHVHFRPWEWHSENLHEIPVRAVVLILQMDGIWV